MTITILIQKLATGYYTGRAKGSGVDIGVNLLVGDRRTRSLEEARRHCEAALTAELAGARIVPSFHFEQLPDRPRRVKTGDQ